MSKILQFELAIDKQWVATIECPGAVDLWAEAKEEAAISPRHLGRTPFVAGRQDEASLPTPVVALHAPRAHDEELDLTEPLPAGAEDDLRAAYQGILARDNADVARFGHYLFDALIGWTTWRYMLSVTDAWAKAQPADESSKPTLELAISIPNDDRDLQRLNWEMLHAGDAFLAAGVKDIRVAVTRRIDAPKAQARALSSPPKYLWVIGSALDDEAIKPGAELMGLLRKVRANRPMNTRILERASYGAIKAMVEEFEPDIVHLICHGDIDESGYVHVLLSQDDGTYAERTTEQLIDDLKTKSNRLPAVVILSACDTGSGGGTERFVLGARETAPMAVDLVAAGVPIVIGMSGRVGDRTCRIFTQQFGDSVIGGSTIIDAIAIARRATFRDEAPPSSSVDWALPSVYLARAVKSDYVPIPKSENDALWRDIREWINSLSFPDAPVFCGRAAFFDRFREMYRPTAIDHDAAHQVLAIKTTGPRLGCTRLLGELAIAAVWDGKIPVYIPPPRSRESNGAGWRAFIGEMAEAIEYSPFRREQLRPLSLNKLLESVLRAPDDLATGAAPTGDPSPKEVYRALKEDLDALLGDAARDHAYFATDHAQVVVLFDELDRWDPKAASMFEITRGRINPIGHHGLGDEVRPIPVVVSVAPTEPAGDLFRQLLELRAAQTWIVMYELEPFSEHEDLLAYRWVLLNPAINDRKKYYGKPWSFVFDPEKNLPTLTEQAFRDEVKGIPSQMVGTESALYLAAEKAIKNGQLAEADDEDYLRYAVGAK